MSIDAALGTLQTEIATLRARIVELEGTVEDYRRAGELSQHQLAAIEAALDGIAILDHEGTYIFMNSAHAHIHGYAEPAELIGQSWTVVVPEECLPEYQQEYMPILQRDGFWRGEVPSKRRDGSIHPTDITLRLIEGGGLICILRDVTEQKRVEAERVQLQEEIIQAQAAALAELSTPLIPISERVMVMPLIGSMDSRRAQQVLDVLLHGISSSHIAVAIIDITGVPIVDTMVANGLLRAAQAVRLLGAEVILTGIRPEVAQTLVGLGTDLGGIITRSSLQSGIAYATTLGKG